MSLVKVAGNASGTGTITIQAPNTNTNYTLDLPAAAGTIQLSGNAISGTTGTFSGTISGGSTIGVGGATPSASGAGITFPATQSASSNANTLDDYEEGTWTPNVGGTATYTVQNGRYTKIGNTVNLFCEFYINAIGTGSTIKISGLPFTSLNIGSVQPIYVCYYQDLLNSITWLSGYVENNASTIQFTGNSTAATTIQNNGFGVFKNSTYVLLSATYYAA